jgi:hypothetical protein
MKHIKKIKTLLVTAVTFGITFSLPAEAQAPKASQQQLLQNLAHNTPKLYAQHAVKAYKWNKAQYNCLLRLWGKESAWNHLADNPHSTAFGIAQMLREKSRNPMVQIDNGLRYIKHRYEQPCNAWRHWQRAKWY